MVRSVNGYQPPATGGPEYFTRDSPRPGPIVYRLFRPVVFFRPPFYPPTENGTFEIMTERFIRQIRRPSGRFVFRARWRKPTWPRRHPARNPRARRGNRPFDRGRQGRRFSRFVDARDDRVAEPFELQYPNAFSVFEHEILSYAVA